MLDVNKKKKYRIIIKNDTPGDSFGLHSSKIYLKKKYKDLKFMKLEKAIEKYFKWINTLAKGSNLSKSHPLEKR